MAKFEIFFGDLRDNVQKEFLEFQGLKNPEDGNYDTFPVAIVVKD